MKVQNEGKWFNSSHFQYYFLKNFACGASFARKQPKKNCAALRAAKIDQKISGAAPPPFRISGYAHVGDRDGRSMMHLVAVHLGITHAYNNFPGCIRC